MRIVLERTIARRENQQGEKRKDTQGTPGMSTHKTSSFMLRDEGKRVSTATQVIVLLILMFFLERRKAVPLFLGVIGTIDGENCKKRVS